MKTSTAIILAGLLTMAGSVSARAQSKPDAVPTAQIKYAEEGERLGCPPDTARQISANGLEVECLDRQGRRHGPYQSFCPNTRDNGQRRRSYTFYYHGKRHGVYVSRVCSAQPSAGDYEWTGNYRDDVRDGSSVSRNSAGKVYQSCVAANRGRDEICDETEWDNGTEWTTRTTSKDGCAVRSETRDSRGRLFKICTRSGKQHRNSCLYLNDCRYLPGGHASTAEVEQLADTAGIRRALTSCYAFQPLAVADAGSSRLRRELLLPFAEVAAVVVQRSTSHRAEVRALLRTRPLNDMIDFGWASSSWERRVFTFTRIRDHRTQAYGSWMLSRCPWK